MQTENVTIEGTITIDGEPSQFRIAGVDRRGWYQWNASTERLSKSAPYLAAIADCLAHFEEGAE